MKKLLIFITLALTMQANIFEGVDVDKILKDSAEKTNLKYEKEMSELINCDDILESVNMLKKDISFKNKGTFSIGYSVNTNHIQINKNYEFYEDNNCLTLEYSLDKKFVSLSFFDNSFGNESQMLLFGDYTDNNNKGFYFKKAIGIVKGYHQTEMLVDKENKYKYWVFNMPNVIYKDYGLCAVVGTGYNFNKNIALEVDLLVNAVVTNVIYRF